MRPVTHWKDRTHARRALRQQDLTQFRHEFFYVPERGLWSVRFDPPGRDDRRMLREDGWLVEPLEAPLPPDQEQ